VAQLVAHLHGMQGVRGSNPLGSTKKPPKPHGLGGFTFLVGVLGGQVDDLLDPSRILRLGGA